MCACVCRVGSAWWCSLLFHSRSRYLFDWLSFFFLSSASLSLVRFSSFCFFQVAHTHNGSFSCLFSQFYQYLFVCICSNKTTAIRRIFDVVPIASILIMFNLNKTVRLFSCFSLVLVFLFLARVICALVFTQPVLLFACFLFMFTAQDIHALRVGCLRTKRVEPTRNLVWNILPFGAMQ